MNPEIIKQKQFKKFSIDPIVILCKLNNKSKLGNIKINFWFLKYLKLKYLSKMIKINEGIVKKNP